MKENIGKIDKICRFIIGALLFYLAFTLENRVTIVVLSGLGTISILESFTGYCGLYQLLKINTKGGK